MSQIFGKAALSAALLAVVGALAFAFAKKDESVKSTTAAKPATGDTFAATVPAALPETSLGWIQKIKVEDNLWAHDLFTPVEVAWNPKTSEYTPKGLPVAPGATVVEERFGLHLVSLKHPKYRLRVSTIAEAPSKALADATIFLIDDDTRGTLKGKVGDTLGLKGAQVKLLKYDPKQTDPKTGAIVKPATVTVRDLALRREIALGKTPIELTDKITVVLAGEDTTAPLWTASALGEKFDTAGATYSIKGVDFEAQTVTVEKSRVTDAVKATRQVTSETLSPTPPAAPVTAPAAPVAAPKM